MPSRFRKCSFFGNAHSVLRRFRPDISTLRNSKHLNYTNLNGDSFCTNLCTLWSKLYQISCMNPVSSGLQTRVEPIPPEQDLWSTIPQKESIHLPNKNSQWIGIGPPLIQTQVSRNFLERKFLQRDPGGLAQGFVDLDLGCSTIQIGQ